MLSIQMQAYKIGKNKGNTVLSDEYTCTTVDSFIKMIRGNSTPNDAHSYIKLNIFRVKSHEKIERARIVSVQTPIGIRRPRHVDRVRRVDFSQVSRKRRRRGLAMAGVA